MVSEQIVNDTVKRMLASNIDEETIVSTLQDTGIDEGEAREIVANVASGKAKSSPQPRQKDEDSVQPVPIINQDTDTKISSMRNEMQAQGEKTELHETATHTMLNDHAEKLDAMNKKVDDVHKVVSTPREVESSLKVRLEEIEKKTDDISAQTTALMEVMKKILDANRELLTELKSK